MFDYFKVSKFFLFIVPLAVVVISITTLFPFIVGRYVWFRISVDLALIFFLLGFLTSRDTAPIISRLKEIFKRPLVIAVSIFATFFLLAGFFGVNPANSFWSNFERGEGGLQILHLWLFFSLISILFKEERDWRRLFGWAIIGGFLSAIYGILAGFNVTGFLGPRFGEDGFRFSGSIGNSSYFAILSLFLMFYSLYLLRDKFNLGGGVLKKLVWPSFLVLFFLVASISAATRGAFLGLIAAVVVFLGYFVYSHRAWRKWLVVVGTLFLILVGVMIKYQDSTFIKSLPVVSRLSTVSLSTETFSTRTIMWSIAWEGFKIRPILGWGPENFLKVFDTHFDTRYFNPTAGFGAWFDRAHSVYFDYLVETGALGLISFIGIFITFFWQIIKTIIKTPKENRTGGFNFTIAFLLSLPVAYLIQGIVLFDVLSTYIQIFLFLAFAGYKLTSLNEEKHAH